MSILIVFFVVSLAVLLFGSILLLGYYYIRKKSTTQNDILQDARYESTSDSLFRISETGDEILGHVKNLYQYVTGSSIVNTSDEILFEKFLELKQIKNKTKKRIEEKVDLFNFDILYDEKDYIKFAVIHDQIANRLIFSSFMIYIRNEDKRLYRSLLELNGSLIPKVVVRALVEKDVAICIEFALYNGKAAFEVYDNIMNMLVATNRQITQIANQKKWMFARVKNVAKESSRTTAST